MADTVDKANMSGNENNARHREILAATTYPKAIALDPADRPIETCLYRCAGDDGEGAPCDFSQCRQRVEESVALKRAGVQSLVSRVVADMDAHQIDHMASLFDGVDVVAPFGVALLMHRASGRPPCGRIASVNLAALAED